MPRYAVLHRDENNQCDDPDFQENEDVIKIHGMFFQKPFVEKPISAEDHNVYIYFPSHFVKLAVVVVGIALRAKCERLGLTFTRILCLLKEQT